jgi:ribosomal protein S18 acetylase RimI-like enzyme
MKIGKVLSLIGEGTVINFGHIHFDSAGEFLSRCHHEEEEYEPDTWGDDARKECENDSDFIEYKEAKALYDRLSNAEKKFVSPRGKYIDSPKLVFRLGEKDGNTLIGFIDVYYFPQNKKVSDVDKLLDDIEDTDDCIDGFITMAVDPAYRGKGIAKTLLNKAAEKAKKVGFDALTYEVEYKNKASINFIQKFSNKFKNETPRPKSDKDSGTLVFRYRFEKDEDEMTSAILSTAPQGGALECGDNYAPGDMRVPKVLGKIQRRKKKA